MTRPIKFVEAIRTRMHRDFPDVAVNAQAITQSVLGALSGSQQVAPKFWVDPSLSSKLSDQCPSASI